MSEGNTGGTALERLAPFIGEWSLPGGGRTVFEWMSGRRFVIQRWEVPHPDVPDGIAIIGPAEQERGAYRQHYFDSRGVARVYAMTFAGGIWRLSRDEPISRRSTSTSGSKAGSPRTVRRSSAAGRPRPTARPGPKTSS